MTEQEDSPLLKSADEAHISDLTQLPPCTYRDLFHYTPSSIRMYFTLGVAHACLHGFCITLFLSTAQETYKEYSDQDEDREEVYKTTRKVALFMYGIAGVLLYTGFVASYCFARVGQTVSISFRKAYFKSILHRDISFFDHPPSSLPAQLTRDCDLIEAGTGEKLLSLVEVIAVIVSISVTGALVCPQVFLIGLIVVPVGVVGNGLSSLAAGLGASIKEKTYLTAGSISEGAVGEIKTVGAFNAQDHISRRYNRELKQSGEMQFRLNGLKGVGWGVAWMGVMALGAVIYWGSAKWVRDERTNWVTHDIIYGADVSTVFWLCAWLCLYLTHLPSVLQVITESRKAGGRAFSFISQTNRFQNGRKKALITGEISFIDVTFAYPHLPDRVILNDVTFVCEGGQKTAIVGESGAGKSTILQLMERFYEVNKGEIRYGEVDLKDMEIGDLRRQVGYVSQEPVLFSMTVKENILMGAEGTLEELETAAKLAGVYNFVMTLPDSFDTSISPKGSHLSLGLKQRIALARALIKRPKVLLLDEPTSSLDSQTESSIFQSLNTLHQTQGLTLISVSQNLSAIRDSHRIVVLKDGRVEDIGRHEELMERKGLYAQMYAAQSGVSAPVSAENRDWTSTQATSDAYTLEPYTTDPVPSEYEIIKKYPVLRLVKSMLKYWPWLILGCLTAVISGCMFPVLGFFVSKLGEFITGPSGNCTEVQKYSIWLLGFAFIAFFAFVVTGFAFGVINSELVAGLREQGFRSLLHMDAAGFYENGGKAGLAAYRLHSDTEKVEDTGGAMVYVVIVMLASYIGTISLGLYYQWKLALLQVLFLPLESICLFRSWEVKSKGLTHPHQQATFLSSEAMVNIKTLTACQGQEEMEEKYGDYLRKECEEREGEGKSKGVWCGLGIAVVGCGLGTSLWYGAYLIKHNETTIVDANIITYSSFLTAIGIATSSLFIPGLIESVRASTRIYSLIDSVPVINSASAEGLTTPLTGEIKFDTVSFKYPCRDSFALRKVSFQVHPGKHLGITGFSGSGKTTITQLLLRFYDPLKGIVYIDGVDIRMYNVRHLRASIALVSQEPVLFTGSVRENVDLGLGKSDGEIKEALKMAAIPKFAEELNREVGIKGGKMSSGQKQRIAIARAILRDPRILLLDEATSALDSRTERKILEALKQAGRGRTILVIAHRLSTIEKSDEILVMDLGEIKERGTHEDLRNKADSRYQKLLQPSKSPDLLHFK